MKRELPGTKEIKVDKLLGEILVELRKKWKVEIWEWESNANKKIQYLTIEDHELEVDGEYLILELGGEYKIINKNQSINKIIKEISNLLKKYIINKSCKREI
jgi:hypothetical protein